ncbi:MAG: hypothetical protein HOV81_06435 [Kofleriaceae bacterium]|nr:hypothetical protein [Kofleriaceae bacterium]
MRRLVVACLVLLSFAGVASAQEAHARLQLDDEPYVGVPFVLGLVADGFDESPAPVTPKLELPNAVVTPLAPQPNVRQSISIMNGHQTASKSVTWVFRYKIEIAKTGRVNVPPLTVTQGSKKATAAGGAFDVASIPSTDEMKISLTLPDRPIFVGENVEATLTWLFRRKPQQDPQFSVPLMTRDDFLVSAPPATDPRQALEFPAGTKTLQLPYAFDQVDVPGAGKFNRVVVKFYVAPKKAGKLELPAASVAAALPVGRADFFGNAPAKLFRVTDTPRTLEVKPLPETDKPASFAGAVGSQFSIALGTSRSVVQLGEPVELAITVKSDQRLDTLSLGRLDGPGGLPKDKFTVPAETPTGELADDGHTKTFKVTAQVTGPATEIPAIAFSYFDPVRGRYQTIHSDPIAVSVKGGSIVGAGDVVAASPTKTTQTAAPADGVVALGAGVDLALSAPGAAGDRPFGGTILWILVGALYLIPLALFAMRTWQLRTAGDREEAAEVRAARMRVEQELMRAAREPARDTAGALVTAMRAFARALDRDPEDDGGLAAKIETESFSPKAASSPLSADLQGRAEDLMKRWTAESKRKKSPRKAAAALILLAVLAPGAADAAPDQALADGRAAYQQAMTVTDASARKAAFARAALSLGEAARATPDRPELLTDWGNAALGAGDVGTATLAYRRALAIDGENGRARKNLNWLRAKQDPSFRPAAGTAADTLFFFHSWPRARRMLVGALAFAVCVLLVIPWSGKRRRGLTGLSVLPAAVWLAMLVSLIVEDRRGDDAVVMDAVVLRAADSAGAPAALASPLPRGAEVTLVERRDSWTKIRLANGTAGWVPGGAVERISQ